MGAETIFQHKTTPVNRLQEKAAYEAQVAANKEILKEDHAHKMHDLKQVLSLRKYFRFKLHMVLKKRDGSNRYIKRSIYGNEHSVTYDQCLFAKVDCIVLDRAKGYNDLIRYVEEDLKGQYIECKIYQDDGSQKFAHLCRRYSRGGLVHKSDPELGEEDVKVLYFATQKDRLLILEEKPEEPDFRTLVNKALK